MNIDEIIATWTKADKAITFDENTFECRHCGRLYNTPNRKQKTYCSPECCEKEHIKQSTEKRKTGRVIIEKKDMMTIEWQGEPPILGVIPSAELKWMIVYDTIEEGTKLTRGTETIVFRKRKAKKLKYLDTINIERLWEGLK